MRRISSSYEQNAIQREPVGGSAGSRHVGGVYRVESAAEKSEAQALIMRYLEEKPTRNSNWLPLARKASDALGDSPPHRV